MPTPNAVGPTSNVRKVFPLRTIARIVQSRFARPDRPMQFLFAFPKCLGHSAVLNPWREDLSILACDQVPGHQRQSMDGAGYNEVVLSSSGSGMSLPLSTLVRQRIHFAMNVDLAKHRSTLARTGDRPSPFALIPSREERSGLLILDDAWYEASPDNPYAIPKSAFMASAKPNRHDS